MVITERHLRRWSSMLLVILGVIAIVSVISWQTLRGTVWNDLFMYVHLGSEFGIAAYFNSGLLALVSAAAVLSAMLTRVARVRYGWLVVAAVALFMSIDEATQLHERTAS